MQRCRSGINWFSSQSKSKHIYQYRPYLAPRSSMKEVELGKQLHSLLRLPSAIDDHSVIAIYATCCACGKRIVSSELAISRIVAESESLDSFIKKANSLVYRRSTLHEENCKWGIQT